LSVYGSAAVTAAFVTLLGRLVIETPGGSLLGLAERLTSSVQTSWPFVVAVAQRRTRAHPTSRPELYELILVIFSPKAAARPVQPTRRSRIVTEALL
jgi:hypothetical protein